MRNKIVYSITVHDIQTVAEQEFDRKLTNEEIESIENEIGDNINWYEAILLAMQLKNIS